MSEEAITEIREARAAREVQPEFVTVDKELLIRAMTAAEDAVEFISESLAKHDADLGRNLKRHKEAAMYMEKRIIDAKTSVNEIRIELGWPARAWKS